MDIKKIISNTLARRIIVTLGIVIAILVVFDAGMAVGFRRASFMDNNSAFGRITKMDQDSFFVHGPQGVDKLVLYNDKTIVRNMRERMSPDVLKLNDYVAVVGTSNNACQLEAKIIRLVPPPPFKK